MRELGNGPAQLDGGIADMGGGLLCRSWGEGHPQDHGLVWGGVFLEGLAGFHLEHSDHGVQGRDHPDARKKFGPSERHQLGGKRIKVRGLIQYRRRCFEVRNIRRVVPGIRVAQGRQMLHLDDHHVGAQRARGASGSIQGMGVTVGAVASRKSWGEKRNQEENQLVHDRRPYCLIVGGGHSGVMLAARLKVLGVPTLIIEKGARLGDIWHNRYTSLSLHTPFFTDDFPYQSYPSTWPTFPSKDQFRDWIESYSKIMSLNYWCSTECKSARFDETAGHWKVAVEKSSDLGGPSLITLHPTHLVLACGFTGHPRTPHIEGAETFQGVQLHSAQFRQGREWRGRKAIVIGASTSAHDICLDLHEQGASEVTMVQRSPTILIRLTTLMEMLPNSDRDSNPSFDLDASDIRTASQPYKVLLPEWARQSQDLAQKEAEFQAPLRKVGYKVHWGEDGGGVISSLYERGGGYYLDMGAAEAIARGGVRLKPGVREIRAGSVVFTDGSESEADVIVYATGYGNVRDHVDSLISREVGARVGRCWGLGSGTSHDPGPWEGELRNMWKPLPVPNLWLTSCSITPGRFFSRHLALQLKARLQGIPTPVFTLPRLLKTAD